MPSERKLGRLEPDACTDYVLRGTACSSNWMFTLQRRLEVHHEPLLSSEHLYRRDDCLHVAAGELVSRFVTDSPINQIQES